VPTIPHVGGVVQQYNKYIFGTKALSLYSHPQSGKKKTRVWVASPSSPTMSGMEDQILGAGGVNVSGHPFPSYNRDGKDIFIYRGKKNE